MKKLFFLNILCEFLDEDFLRIKTCIKTVCHLLNWVVFDRSACTVVLFTSSFTVTQRNLHRRCKSRHVAYEGKPTDAKKSYSASVGFIHKQSVTMHGHKILKFSTCVLYHHQHGVVLRSLVLYSKKILGFFKTPTHNMMFPFRRCVIKFEIQQADNFSENTKIHEGHNNCSSQTAHTQ